MPPMAASLIQPVASSLINDITGKGQEGGFLQLLTLPLMMKVLGKGVRRAGRGYNNMDKKCLVLLHLLSNIVITKYFNYESRFNSIFSRDSLPRLKDGACHKFQWQTK